MRIENEIKLDYRDVLLRPKRSTLGSRSDVTLKRLFKFRHTAREWFCHPIVAANMDHTGTLEMADALEQHNMLVCLGKHLNHNASNFDKERSNVTISTGILDNDWKIKGYSL